MNASQAKPAPAPLRRRGWYRLSYAAALAVFLVWTAVNLHGREKKNAYVHGFPNEFLVRMAPPAQQRGPLDAWAIAVDVSQFGASILLGNVVVGLLVAVYAGYFCQSWIEQQGGRVQFTLRRLVYFTIAAAALFWVFRRAGWELAVAALFTLVYFARRATFHSDSKLFEQASRLCDQGDYVGALAIYDQLVEKYPASGVTHCNRAVCHYSLGDLEQCFAAFDQAIEAEPESPEVWLSRADVLAGLERFEDALADVERAAEYGADVKLWQFRGSLYSRLRKQDKAEADFNRCIEADPKRWEPYLGRAAARFARLQRGAALADCRRLLQLNPDCAQAYFLQGIAYTEQGWFDQAAAAFERAIEISADGDPAVYYRRGALRAITGALDEAEQDWRRAREMYAAGQGDLGIAVLELRLGNAGAAEKLLDKLLERSDDGIARFHRGLARAAREDWAGALADFRRACELDPYACTPLYLAGEAAEKLGDVKQAAADRKRALQGDPHVENCVRLSRSLPQLRADAARDSDQPSQHEPTP